jgi:prophage tail gpP-like protein
MTTPDTQTVTITAQRPTGDEVSITVDDLVLTGWTGVSITRGLERMPSSFELMTTERYPLNADALVIKPGAECTVRIGTDPIITGYVDRVMPSIDDTQHIVRVAGRGKCCDLVDCSAEWPNMQFASGFNVYQIAANLARQVGIGVEGHGDMGGPLPYFMFGSGESIWSIIETWCRVRQLVAYERTDGNLQLLYAATQTGMADPFPAAASGFAEGVNIERAAALWDTASRYSEYRCDRVSVDPLREVGSTEEQIVASAKDPGITRHRVLRWVQEYGSALGVLASQQRAQWEAKRRFGRAGQIRLTTDAWRDSSGALYDIGKSVPVDAPSLKASAEQNLAASGLLAVGAPWVIAEIEFVKDESGTHANLSLMQRHAFDPQPTAPPNYHLRAEVAALPDNLARP